MYGKKLDTTNKRRVNPWVVLKMKRNASSFGEVLNHISDKSLSSQQK